MTHLLTSNIAQYGYLAIFLAMVLESACIPIPSEVVMPFGGYLAVVGHLNFWGVVIAGTLGNLAGSLIAYAVGRYGGRIVVQKFGRQLHLSEKHLAKAEHWFARYGELSVLLGRVFPVIRTFISLPAGIAQMRFWRFVTYTTAGSLPWVYMLTWAGADLGKHWANTVHVLHPVTYLILIAIVIFIVIYIGRRVTAANHR